MLEPMCSKFKPGLACSYSFFPPIVEGQGCCEIILCSTLDLLKIIETYLLSIFFFKQCLWLQILSNSFFYDTHFLRIIVNFEIPNLRTI